MNRVSQKNQNQIKERISNPVSIPYHSLFIPKNALPIYLPNDSLLIKNNTETPIQPIQLPPNSILVPNEGPVTKFNQSALVVNSNYGPPLNLPNGSLIGSNGQIMIPLQKLSLMIGNDKKLYDLFLNSSRLINNNETRVLILPIVWVP